MNPFLCRKALAVSAGAFFILSILSSCESFEARLPDSNDPVLVAEVSPRPEESAPMAQVNENGSTDHVLAFLGDVIIHERLRKREEVTKEGYHLIWSAIQKYMNQAHTRYANLEGPVAPDMGGPTGFPLFNFPEIIIPELKNAGFDIVSTSNNHALDRQAMGIRKTIENLNKYSLKYSGTVSSPDAVEAKKETWWALTPIRNSSQKLAWLACTEMTNGNKDKEDQVLYCYKNREKIKILIQELSQMPEVAGIILTPHWGEEEKFDIEPGRRAWAQQMINEGATAIVGSHPHVIQKVEFLNAKDGRKALVAYSLGNFVSNQPWVPNRTSMFLFAKLKLNSNNKAEIMDVRYIPLWMIRTIEKDETAKYRIYPIWDMKAIPKEAISIWSDQLGNELRFKSEEEFKQFFK